MDIIREPPKKTRRNLLLGLGAVVILAITVWTLSLDPASQSIDRSAVLIDSVRQGDVVREVRGPGTLVPEHIRWITAQASARVERLASEPGKHVAAGDLLLELSNPDLQIQTHAGRAAGTPGARSSCVNLKTNAAEPAD